jgi:hypothetical protein
MLKNQNFAPQRNDLQRVQRLLFSMSLNRLLPFTVWLLLLSDASFGQTLFPAEALEAPDQHRALFESLIPIREIPVYTERSQAGMVLLENGYAEYEFQNKDWPPQGDARAIPTAVQIIFTKYPKDKSFWLTDYHWLLAKRLSALFELDPRFNDSSVQFSILLQTECDNEFEALQLFHGMELHYRIETDDLPDEQRDLPPENTLEAKPQSTDEWSARDQSAVRKVQRFMAKERYYMDSSVYNVLDRHPEWQDALVVIDWTGSMYGYGAEVLLWHAMNGSKSGIKHLAFFNDGDHKPARKKGLGTTGGVYLTEASPHSKTLRYFTKVMRNGNGGDSPENDIEALIRAIDAFPKDNDVILIADNRSCIRDFVLVSCLDRPVHVILCDTRKDVNHQYINLVWKTGGSLHGIDWDLTADEINQSLDSIVIEGVSFTMTRDGWLMPSDRFGMQAGFGFCTRYYRAPKRRNTVKRRKEPECYFTN